MPSATLAFTLPDDADDFRAASNAGKLCLALSDLDQQLRAWVKYGHEFKTAGEALAAARDELHRLLDEHECSWAME